VGFGLLFGVVGILLGVFRLRRVCVLKYQYSSRRKVQKLEDREREHGY